MSTTKPMTRADQALAGLDVVAANGIVRVRDGMDTWLCRQPNYDAAVQYLELCEAYPSDEGGADAYTALCRLTSGGGAVASVVGTCRGDWQALVREAVVAGLVDPDDAPRMYGVEIARVQP